MEIDTQEIVEECLELLRNGRSLEECLEQYPAEAVELEPILRTAISVRADLATDLPRAARTRIRDRVLAEWDHPPKRWAWRLPTLFPRWAFATAILVLTLVIGGLGTNNASANSVPGDMLYPVKEFRESVQLWLARSPEAKVERYTSLVKERVEEVRKLAAKQQADLDAISDALARMESHLAALNIVVESRLTNRAANNVDRDFVEAVQNSIAEQGAAEGLLATALDRVPVEARPEFSNALSAIKLAQDRVDAALEAVGYSGSGN